MILAARFGGTPWEWREKATPMDWGTALDILQAEREQVESMRERMETR